MDSEKQSENTISTKALLTYLKILHCVLYICPIWHTTQQITEITISYSYAYWGAHMFMFTTHKETQTIKNTTQLHMNKQNSTLLLGTHFLIQ